MGPRHTSRAAFGVLTALAVALSVLVGGCTDDEGSEPGPVERVLADNRVEYDLRQPLTREEVGLAPGEALLAIDHPGGEPHIDVTVILPGEVRLEVAVSVVNIAAIGDGEPDPDSLELVRTFPSVDAAADELLANAEVLDLDPDAIGRWAEWARGFMAEDGTEGGATFASRAFPNTEFDGVILSASAGAYADTGTVRVHYHLSWDAGGD